jgi:ribonuclease H / adenosylcobalamin/alpha-ribazole phosphatase
MRDVLVGRNRNIGLTRHGAEQAQKAASCLAGVTIRRIVSSPQRRTLDTAAIIAKAKQLPIETDEAFDELDFGEWAGRKFSDLESIPAWKTFNQFRSFSRAPGGESLTDVQSRTVAAITRLRASFPGETIVLVTHSDVIRTLLTFFCGAPLDSLLRFRIDPASLTTVEVADWGATVMGVNRAPCAERC